MKDRIKVYLYNKTFKEIDMSDFTKITEDLFAERNDIVKVELPEGVEEIGNITIPNGVIKIGNHAFENCANLQEVICPDSLKKIGIKAFADCANLKKVNYSEDVKVDATAFAGCPNMQ